MLGTVFQELSGKSLRNASNHNLQKKPKIIETNEKMFLKQINKPLEMDLEFDVKLVVKLQLGCGPRPTRWCWNRAGRPLPPCGPKSGPQRQTVIYRSKESENK